MPANRMKAAVGSTLKVIGKSSAMVSAGPRPGSTPIAVPSVVPSRHHSRLVGVSATAKPFASCESVSMARSAPRQERADATLEQLLDHARANIDAERLGEPEIGQDRHHEADRGV